MGYERKGDNEMADASMTSTYGEDRKAPGATAVATGSTTTPGMTAIDDAKDEAEAGGRRGGEKLPQPVIVDSRQISQRLIEVPVGVVEQRVSNLVQGSLCLVLMTGPFQHVLGLIPRGKPRLAKSMLKNISFLPLGVLAGLFFAMGTEGVLTSGVTAKFLYLIQDHKLVAPEEPLRKVRKSMVILFLIIELVGFGATMAITQTIGQC